MLGIIIGIFLFLLTIPMKTIELGMKLKDKGKNIKDRISNDLASEGSDSSGNLVDSLKSAGGKTLGAGSSIASKGKGALSKLTPTKKGKNKKGAKDKAKSAKKTGENAKKLVKGVKVATKVAIKAIKALIVFVRSIATIIASLGAVTTILILVAVLILLACLAGAFLLLSESGGSFTGSNTASNTDASEDSEKTISDEEAVKSWLAHCDKVYDLMLKSGTQYSQSKWTTIEIDGKKYDWRPDCSGTVAVYLCSYGEIDSTSHTVGTLVKASYKSFQVLQIGKDIKEPDDLRAGDIFAATDKHVLIITKYDADTDTASGYNMPGSGHTVEEWSNKVTKSGNYFKISGTSGGNYDYVIRPKGHKVAAAGDWIFYFQGQSPWGDSLGDNNGVEWIYTGINDKTYRGQGCGITSASMVIATYANANGADMDKKVTIHIDSASGGSGDPSGNNRKPAGNTAEVYEYTPPAVREHGYEKYGYIPITSTGGDKNAVKLYIDSYPECKVECTAPKDGGTFKLDELDEVLAKGGCMIACYGSNVTEGGVGIWTNGGHYIVIRGGSQKDGYYAADPAYGHEIGSSGISSWAPYNKHVFESKCLVSPSYYYYIIPK